MKTKEQNPCRKLRNSLHCNVPLRNLGIISSEPNFSSEAKKRDRKVDEIVPQYAELSQKPGTAYRAIDLNLATKAVAKKGSDGGIWLKVSLGQLYCVDRVIEYDKRTGTNQFKWTCSQDDCATCESRYDCRHFLLTVDAEDTPPNLSSTTGCKYGDSVKLKRVPGTGETITVAEIAIFGKKGIRSLTLNLIHNLDSHFS